MYLKSYEHLLYFFVPNWWGWSNWNFWEKNPQIHVIISNKWLNPHSLPPILTNLDHFLPGAFYSTPTLNIRHKRVYSVCTHWIDQDLLLRPNKIKKYWSLPLTDSSILWHFCKCLTLLERYCFCHLVFFVLEIRVAGTINWYLFHVHLLVSSQLFSRKMDKNRYLYELWYLLTASQFKFFYEAIL